MGLFVLAADTSTVYNAVSVTDDDAILCELTVRAGRSHSERLLEAVDFVLTEAGVSLDAIGLLAVSIGPGSFTGLRVGTAAWKGLALATNLPLIGAPTLDAMARACGGTAGVVCPMLDARMSEVFAAAYVYDDAGERRPVIDAFVGPVEEILDRIPDGAAFYGDGARMYWNAIAARRPAARLLSPSFDAPRAVHVAAEARALFEGGANADASRVAPVYLRQAKADKARARQGAVAP